MEETAGISGVFSKHMDLGLRLTPSGLQLWSGSLKGISGLWGENEVSGIRASGGGQLPPGQDSRGQVVTVVPFLSPPPHRATEWQHHI